MKLLQISNYYPPHVGGVEQVAYDISSALAGEGIDRQVFCFQHEGGDAEDEVDGVRVVRAGCFAKVASQSLSFSYGRLLKKTFEAFAPDTVIFHYPNPFGAHYLLKLLKKRPQVRLILWWHLDITKQKLLGKLFEGQTRRLLSRAQTVVATSPDYVEGSKWLRSVREKCTVISCCASDAHIGEDGETRASAAAIRARYAGKIVCFAVGRHVPYKGMEYLVRASRLLDDRFRIFIAGEGPLTPQLKELAAGDGKVSFLGKVSDADLKAYLSACDLFCFPSVTKNEAFGIALAEAMTFGKPSVTFRIEGSGVNYVSLDGVTGLEAENANAESFASCMRVLADDVSLRTRLGCAAKERAGALFTFRRFAEQTVRLIKEDINA